MANLERADCSYATLLKTAFVQTNLTATDLSHASLRDTLLIKANLSGSSLVGAILSGYRGLTSVPGRLNRYRP